MNTISAAMPGIANTSSNDTTPKSSRYAAHREDTHEWLVLHARRAKAVRTVERRRSAPPCGCAHRDDENAAVGAAADPDDRHLPPHRRPRRRVPLRSRRRRRYPGAVSPPDGDARADRHTD